MFNFLKAMTTLTFLCALVLVGYQGCSSGSQACKRSSDCSDTVYRCIKRVCVRTCKQDKDCSGGKTCIDDLCGGIPESDAGPTDQGECRPGESRECYSGAKGTKGTGLCKGGTQECGDDAKWGGCEGEVVPAEEECNGKDDDCDSQVDEGACSGNGCKPGETRACYSGPASTKGVGRCKAGKETCIKIGNDYGFGDCEGQELPVLENCQTQIDENCDGQVNEGCQCSPGETRKCKAGNGCGGLQSCRSKGGGSDWGECTASKPTPEDCDGFDNDCDGKIDNIEKTSDPLKRDCNNVCFKGSQVCKAGTWSECDAPLPKEEECNGIDDDCDGKIDNIKNKTASLIRACKHPTAKGICASAAGETCKNGTWGECTPSKPDTEKCNDVDDDCDGETDEDADKPCGQGKCIRDKAGVKKCVSG